MSLLKTGTGTQQSEAVLEGIKKLEQPPSELLNLQEQEWL